MKAKNSKEVTKGYLLFAVALCFSILLGIGCVYSFTITANQEMKSISVRSSEYDRTFSRQIVLTERVDSLFQNLTMLNSNKQVNQLVLQNKISHQKMNLINTLGQIDSGDALLYQRMSDEMNDLLQVKDSIRMVSEQVELVKGELKRCIEDNKTATRRMVFQQ